MKILQRLTLALLLGLAVAALGACSDDAPGGNDVQGTQLRLRIAVPSSSSRAYAEGYGSEEGTDNENAIDNLTIYFYRGIDGPNADAAFTNVVFVTSELFTTEPEGAGTYGCTIPLAFAPQAGDRIAVLVNMDYPAGIETMADLRALTARGWVAGKRLSESRHFAMSSALAVDGIVEASPSADNIWQAEVTVERLAARIDLWFDPSNISPTGHALLYTTTDGGSQVEVTDVLPVNVNSRNTWALKHFTTEADPDNLGNTVVCSREYLGADGLPSVYVVEPHTAVKGTASADLDYLYGDTRASRMESDYLSLFAAGNGSIKGFLADAALMHDTTGRFSRALTIAYANENTQTVEAMTADYMTGFVLRARFMPGAVTGADGEPVDYTPGSDFVRCRTAEGKDFYFADMAAFNAWHAASGTAVADVALYPGGVCYYTVWLNHRLDELTGSETGYRMQYATVRNHIYRMGFTFGGPGYVRPTLDEPYNVRAIIYARKWNFRRLTQIIV